MIKKEAVVLKAEIATKNEMIDFLIVLHEQAGNITDRDVFKDGILKREAEGPTAITDGICIPHSKNSAVIHAGITAVTVPSGVDCGALDGQAVKPVFYDSGAGGGSGYPSGSIVQIIHDSDR